MRFRKLQLPADIPGNLFLHSMPGRYETLEDALNGMEGVGISTIVSLTSDWEIDQISPGFAARIRAGTLPVRRISEPVHDFSVPTDKQAFQGLSSDLAQRLTDGESILIHCAAGIGRTGTLATCVLLALGLDTDQADEWVRAAGSSAESRSQRELITWLAQRQTDQAPAAGANPPPASVVVMELPTIQVASLKMDVNMASGQHSDQIGQGFHRVGAWAAAQTERLPRPLVIGIPQVENEQLVGYTCCVQVPDSMTTDEPPIRVRPLDGGRYAVVRCQKEPEKIGAAMAWFFQSYVPQWGLKLDGSRSEYEIYAERTVEQCIPVK